MSRIVNTKRMEDKVVKRARIGNAHEELTSKSMRTISNVKVPRAKITPRTPCTCANCWKFKKEPKLGRDQPISVIEALADSANQYLVMNNIDMVKDRVSRIMALCREIIRVYPEDLDMPRCKHPTGRKHEPTRNRCKIPLINGKCTVHPDSSHNKNMESLEAWL